ncbi:helix-turn-helix transcriptional regulator [Saccharopolyspora hattusasensis]|uniref:helix-turn-helix transcriptional regulator n=1 Tax=Saccharopolyspora hattusasensis TaxID=1128679 RepID=UPI003D95DDFC
MSATASRSTKNRPTISAGTDRAALPTEEAAHYMGLSYSTLKKWRVTGDGPAYVRIGSRIVYLIEDLDTWLLAHRVA